MDPRDAPGLVHTFMIVEVDHLRSRNEVPLLHQVRAYRVPDPVADRASDSIDLHAHSDLVLGATTRLVHRLVDQIGIDRLECKAMSVAIESTP